MKIFWVFVFPNVVLFTLAMVFDYDINAGDRGLYYGIVSLTWMGIAANKHYPGWGK